MRIKGSPKTIVSFQRFEGVWTSWPQLISSKGKSLGSHMVGWEYMVHPDTPAMIGCSGR